MRADTISVLRNLNVGVELGGDLRRPLSTSQQRRLRELFQALPVPLRSHARGGLRNSGPRTLQKVVTANKGFYELCPQFRPDDPAYLKWLNASARP